MVNVWAGFASSLLVLTLTLCQGEDLEPLTIKRVVNDNGDSYTIEYDTGKLKTQEITSFELTISVPDTEERDIATTDPGERDIAASDFDLDNKTATFNDSITTYAGKTNVAFVLNGLDDSQEPLIVGETKWETFPTFPTIFEGHLGTIKQNDDIRILRYIFDGKNMELDPKPDGVPVHPNDNIYYYLNAGPEDSFTPCFTKQLEAEVCDSQKTMQERVIAQTLQVDEATLSYIDDNKATVTMKINSTASPSPDKLEVIANINSSTDSILLLPETSPEISFDLDLEVPGTSNIELFIIGLETDSNLIGLETDSYLMKKYVIHELQDYDVTGYAISDKSLEVRWKIQSKITDYLITLDEDGKGVKDIPVHCDELMDYCFGYFTDLTSDKNYTVTVKTNVDNKPNLKNQVQSAAIYVPASEGEINIDKVQMLERNGQEVKASLCFNHTTKYSKGSSSPDYEVVIVNNHKGQWTKDKLHCTKHNDHRWCSSGPFSIDGDLLKDDETAQVIVIQRASDGLSVLASGETQLL